MRDGGGVLLTTCNRNGKERPKAPKRAMKRRKTTENSSRTLHSLTKVAAREDDLGERSRDTRTRGRLVDRASFTIFSDQDCDYHVGNSMVKYKLLVGEFLTS